MANYFTYYLQAQSAYNIKSTELKQWAMHILEDQRWFDTFGDVIATRHFFAHMQEAISWQGEEGTCLYRDIVKNKEITDQQGQLLFRLLNHQQPQSIFIANSHLGLSNMYARGARHHAHLLTWAAHEQAANVMQGVFQRFKVKGVDLLTSTTELELALNTVKQLDFLLLENMSCQQALDCFAKLEGLLHQDSVILIRDIHKNTEQAQLWAVLKNKGISIDVYHSGIILFKQSAQPKHYTLIPSYLKFWMRWLF